jgi:hypothetical protein
MKRRKALAQKHLVSGKEYRKMAATESAQPAVRVQEVKEDCSGESTQQLINRSGCNGGSVAVFGDETRRLLHSRNQPVLRRTAAGSPNRDNARRIQFQCRAVVS